MGCRSMHVHLYREQRSELIHRPAGDIITHRLFKAIVIPCKGTASVRRGAKPHVTHPGCRSLGPAAPSAAPGGLKSRPGKRSFITPFFHAATRQSSRRIAFDPSRSLPPGLSHSLQGQSRREKAQITLACRPPRGTYLSDRPSPTCPLLDVPFFLSSLSCNSSSQHPDPQRVASFIHQPPFSSLSIQFSSKSNSLTP